MLSIGGRCRANRHQCSRTAASLHSSDDMGQAAALVASQGGIVLGTGGYTYDRFVAHRGFCLRSEVAQTVWVPTRDTPNCHLRRCKEAEHMDR